MSSIRCAMLCGTDDDEEAEQEGVDVFEIGEGEDVDFVRLHMIMLRECRRLNEGLPIYAYRRKILDHIFSNQVGFDDIANLLCSVSHWILIMTSCLESWGKSSLWGFGVHVIRLLQCVI